VKFCRDFQTQRGRQQPTCAPGRKRSFAGVFEPMGRQQPTCTPRTEKQEAMNGTGDMARNPRIKGDVMPKQKEEGQKRGKSLSVIYYRDVATERRGERSE
jgi:hypothetical protein